MKRTERKHLKENDLAQTLATARDYMSTRGRQVTLALVAVVLVVGGIVGITLLRQRSQNQGQDLLAEALVALNAGVVPAGEAAQGADVPAAATIGATGTFSTEEAKLNAAVPKLKLAADTFPDSKAGIVARYHLAGALAALGKNDEAVQTFDQVIQRAGQDSLYGRMSRLGKADAQSRAGQLDAAIATWKELASQNSDEVPTDAVLMELARAYLQKGNTAEARKTFTQIVDQHPSSPYSTEAQRELDNLKG